MSMPMGQVSAQRPHDVHAWESPRIRASATRAPVRKNTVTGHRYLQKARLSLNRIASAMPSP